MEVDSGVGKQANLSTWQIRLANGIHTLICIFSENSTTFANFLENPSNFSYQKGKKKKKTLLMGYRKHHFHEIELFLEV